MLTAKRGDKERGQALLILAFGLLALAAFAGLAIDGGRYYAERRQTQNAADAAALAGAGVLAEFISTCASADTANDNRVASAIVDMAQYNGVDHFSPEGNIDAWYVDADLRPVGRVGWAAGIPHGATGIKTTLTFSDTATFMRLLGRSHLVNTAEAVAMIGPVVQTEGRSAILPIAVPEAVVATFQASEKFTVFDDGLFCRGGNPESCYLPPSDKGITETEELSPGAFYGWLNLSHVYNNAYWSGGPLDRAFGRGAGASGCKYKPDGTVDVAKTGLKGWLSRTCPYPYPLFAGDVEEKEGDYIYGYTGTRTAALLELAANYRKGDVLYWLIFDEVYTSKEMEKAFPGQAPAVGWMTAGGPSRASYYHIVGFTAVELINIDSRGSEKSITGVFQNAVLGEGMIDPGSGMGSGDKGTCRFPTLIAVKLWE
ncbi:MAG: pilus assembly protein TadG-related protein [Anaerolineae bacterium]